MLTKNQMRKAKQGKLMSMGLRSASTAEIDAIKKQLRDNGIKFEHRIHNLKYNGVIVINPKRTNRMF